MRAKQTANDHDGHRPRRPSVAGVAGGVGATTVATALGATDWGVFAGHPVDVLVCRATGDSLIRAGRAAQRIAADGHGRPVLAVTAAGANGPSRPVTARLRLLEPHAAVVLVLPFVRRWVELSTPLDDLRGLAGNPLTELPRALRRYAAAIRDLQAAVNTAAPHHVRPVSPRRSSIPLPERTPPRCAP